MAKKLKEDDPKYKHSSLFEGVRPHTRQSILIVVAFAFSLIFFLAIVGKAGMGGALIADGLTIAFGNAKLVIPFLFFFIGLSLIFYFRPSFFAPALIGGGLFLVSILGFVDIVFGEKTAGYAGFLIATPFLKFFDIWASSIIMIALFSVSVLLILNASIIIERKKNDIDVKDGGTGKNRNIFQGIKDALSSLRGKEKQNPPLMTIATEIEAEQRHIETSKENEKEESKEVADKQKNEREPADGFAGSLKKFISTSHPMGVDFKMPPPDLLEDDRGKPSSGDVKANGNIIKRTLKNFGIEVEMAEINVGPSITQYTLRPAEGVKLSKITALQSDLALALAAHPIRIEAPIPGRSLVGIEIPNRVVALVGLRSLLSQEGYVRSKYALTIALGRDVAGAVIYGHLEKMPHLLIAGATGSGKSVAIHAIMMSLLYRNGPDNLRFLLVDPKRVELSAYSGIPHLLTPVITDAKKTILALKWAASEMERRYEVLSSVGARDVHSYQVTEEALKNPMPYIIIIVDELADIMATYPRELEASIVRLAQMSRAVGIHLIVSTQRPSVEVITGLIKANITARIAFQVASQIDSRTILDMSGAEKLLGNGDMLYLAGDSAKPKRIQGGFVSEKEVRKVTQYLEDQYANYDSGSVAIGIPNQAGAEEKDNSSIFDGVSIGDEAADELYEEAKKLVIEAKKASASYLQRRLRIGYARAARLLDVLEERGVIGPGDGAKAREVYGIDNGIQEEEVESNTSLSEPSLGREPSHGRKTIVTGFADNDQDKSTSGEKDFFESMQ